VGADSKESRMIRGYNMGVLLSFFDCTPKRLKKAFKSTTGIQSKVKETKNEDNVG